MSDIKKIIGDRVRSLRLEKDWSQEELAHRAGISPSHVGRLERGERGSTIHSLEKVTNALGISFEDLFRFINVNQENTDRDMSLLYELINKLSKRSRADQQTMLNILNVLPRYKDEK